MKHIKVIKHLNGSSLLASAIGLGSVGAAVYGVPGAIVGIVFGFGLGYWSELAKSKADHSASHHSRQEA